MVPNRICRVPARHFDRSHGVGRMQSARRRVVHRFVLGALVAGGLIAVLAEVRAQLAPGEDTPVLAAQETLGQAIRSGDKSVARRLLSLQFTYVDQNGKLFERRPFLDNLKDMAAAATDGTVKIYGGIAVVTGQRKSAPDGDVFFLDIWAKQRGAWRVLTMQDVVLAAAEAPRAAPPPPSADTKPAECKNPCQTIPYRVRSPVEQDIVNAFQALEKANIAHDSAEWAGHVADEFVLYRSGRAPINKPERITAIERQKETNAAVTVGEVESMRLSAYGDGAAMIASHVAPDNSRPAYRAARVWVKRNGQWLLVTSAQTDVK
jgi:hypothetical protein